jgi:PPOX class probable FMN-dependent enzyme
MVHRITSEQELRALYEEPLERALRKQIDRLDEHCRAYIARSPFALLATAGADGRCDVSPRGGPPGFCRVLDGGALAIPDVKGNRRLDSLTNIVESAHAGLLFVIPGMQETLRVNGAAELTRDPLVVEAVSSPGRPATLAIVVEPEEVFMHCAKAFIRSALWEPATWPAPQDRPPAAEIMRDHMQSDLSIEEVAAQSAESIRTRLY